ncbi:MAG TPA: ABC transporter permease, partial [Holophagaceae bacterium]|nr:ABC transporter permease [Holophagaceae bacterium]
MSLSRRLVLRALARERLRASLCILAVALGVGVFLAVRLANRAAVASFEGFARGLGQGADLVVESGAGPLPESALRDLAALRDQAWFRPVLEGGFSGPGQEPFQLMGLDLIGLAGTGPSDPEPSASAPGPAAGASPRAQTLLYELIQDPHAVMISTTFAREAHLRPGDPLPGFVDGRPVTLRVVGVAPDPPDRPALQRDVLVMDLPAAQALLHREGEVDRLELGARPGSDLRELEARARALLPPGLALVPPEQRAESGRTMTAAFRFNLAVLSLIALAVGAYLLFQAFDSAVERRRETWATLRALGCPPRRVLGLVLLEAALLGTAGSLGGLLVGWGLAQGAVKAVSRTVNTLYGASSASHASLLPGEALLASGLGLAACLVAAWVPARRAAGVPPVHLLARGAEARPMRWRRAASAGSAALLAGLALAFLPDLPPGVAWHAYGGAGLMLAGGSLATLALLPLLGAPSLRARDWRLRLAFRPLLRPTGRHGLAAAALAVALGMAVGMGVMVASFERTVMAWIGTSLHADLYIAPLGAAGPGSKHRLEPDLVERIASDPAIAAVDRFELRPITLFGQPTYLASGEFGVEAGRRRLVMVSGGDGGEAVPSRGAQQ